MWRKWIVTLGPAGLIPLAPGTWGTLLTVAVLLGLHGLLGLAGPVAPAAWMAVLLATAALASFACVILGPWAIAFFGKNDPGAVVIDEAAGVCLALVALPMLPGRSILWTFLAAFVAFRIFDIAKPWPIHRLERFPAGWGILCDDLLAGVYANVLAQIALRLMARA